MISGIHLATALSVMLHMEQEGSGMDSRTDKMSAAMRELSEHLYLAEGSYDTEAEVCALVAARLSEQQQVIDELVNAMEMIAGITPCPDDLMGNVDIAHAALSRVKGHTKETE